LKSEVNESKNILAKITNSYSKIVKISPSSLKEEEKFLRKM